LILFKLGFFAVSSLVCVLLHCHVQMIYSNPCGWRVAVAIDVICAALLSFSPLCRPDMAPHRAVLMGPAWGVLVTLFHGLAHVFIPEDFLALTNPQAFDTWFLGSLAGVMSALLAYIAVRIVWSHFTSDVYRKNDKSRAP